MKDMKKMKGFLVNKNFMLFMVNNNLVLV